MEEEDRRSLAEEPKKPIVTKKNVPSEIVFASSDIRYKNVPIQGYTVIPSSSNGMDRQTGPTPPPPPMSGRPLLGQGRRQEARNDVPPRMSVPGLIQLPLVPPPEPSRLSPRRGDVGHSGGMHPASYDRSRQPQDNRDQANRSYRKAGPQRTLFDPANPHKPIVVAPRDEGNSHPVAPSLLGCPEVVFQSLPADQGNNSSKPAWYDTQSER